MTVFSEFFNSYNVTLAKPVRARKNRLSILAVLAGVVIATAVRFATRVRREALTVAGLGLLAAAAWNLSTWAGLAATGVACLVLEHLLSD
jgi:hypothetical protein